MCKCKWFTFTQDLHAISMTIDTYTQTPLKITWRCEYGIYLVLP
jgi:hypothetical protein